jgi:1-acyl-sn-glycerol-3-phosphate acyltransferase
MQRRGPGVIYVLRYLLAALYTVFWSIPAMAAALVDRSGESVIWIGRTWLRWILATCRVKVVSEGAENVDPRQPYVFMSNHQSVFDIAAIITTIPVSFRFVAKRELLRIPFFGWALGLSNQIVIDRGNREKAVRTLRAAARRIRDGASVIIFPEGTRSPTGELREFKSGGFHLALEAGVPVLPVTVSGSQRITPKRSLRVESGEIKVVYGKPIATRGLGLDDRATLKERVREAIQQGFDPLYQEARAALA